MQTIAVFDTNVFISALLSIYGAPFKSLAKARAGEIASVTCREILDELREKKMLKFEYSEAQAAVAVREIESFSRVVTVSRTLQGICSDPDDDVILECAVVAQATHLVTGDKRHLLPLKSFQQVTILNPRRFSGSTVEMKR